MWQSILASLFSYPTMLNSTQSEFTLNLRKTGSGTVAGGLLALPAFLPSVICFTQKKGGGGTCPPLNPSLWNLEALKLINVFSIAWVKTDIEPLTQKSVVRQTVHPKQIYWDPLLRLCQRAVHPQKYFLKEKLRHTIVIVYKWRCITTLQVASFGVVSCQHPNLNCWMVMHSNDLTNFYQNKQTFTCLMT